jgi:hypothetical protein
MNLLTGAMFNANYGNKFYFCTLLEYIDYRHTGLNIDHNEWIEFIDVNYIHMWINEHIKFMRYVEIPNDAKVSKDKYLFKTDKAILSKKIYIWNNYELCKQIIQCSPMCFTETHPLQYVNIWDGEQLIKLYELSFTKNGSSIQYAIKYWLIPELCNIAVMQDAKSLQYIPVDKQTYQTCLLAVSRNGYGNISQYANITAGGYNLKYVNPELQDKFLCEKAIVDFPYAIQYINKNNFSKKDIIELYTLAININPFVLSIIDEEFQTCKICLLAIRQNYDCVMCIKNIFLNIYVKFIYICISYITFFIKN